MRVIRFGVIACIATVLCIATAEAQTFTVLHRFGGSRTDGQRPIASMIWGPGNTTLFGVTTVGGPNGGGTVYQVSLSGRETFLYSFGSGTDAALPTTLVRGPGGTAYGTSTGGGNFQRGTIFKVAKVGNTLQESVLYSFKGGTDGSNPSSGLVWDAAGNLYGTTSGGGGSAACFGGCGTVFKVNSTTGQETVLHTFQSSPDGAGPASGLVRDSAGNLYGTTEFGGASNDGTVFMLSPNGVMTILHSFTGTPDGNGPFAGLLRDSAGNLFGTTSNGGTSTNPECGFFGCGTVFEITSGGVESVLYSFSGTDDADEGGPSGGLVEDTAGNLYGTAMGFNNGATCVDPGAGGCGTIFKLDPSGTLTTLHNFSWSDGAAPWATMIMDSSGNLYGNTISGGLGLGNGVVFKLTP